MVYNVIMKVHAVSFSSNTHAEGIGNLSGSVLNPFFYTSNAKDQKQQFQSNLFRMTTACLAALAVGITIVNIRGKSRYSKDIIEIADKNLGLNRITKYPKTVNELKEKVLYPLISTIKGDKSFLSRSEFKSGIVITGHTVEEAKTVVEAFCEHASELGVRMKKALPEKTPEGTPTKFTTRASRIKMIYKALKEAQEHYKNTGEYTVVNIDNISLLANFKAAKPTNSKFEDFIKAFDKNTYPGVLWVASNPKSQALPYFFNNIPILMTKLVD